MIVSIIIVSALVIIAIYLLWANKAIKHSKIQVYSKKLPPEFENFRIAHISDFHNEPDKKYTEKLCRKIQSVTADIIVITGDLIDSRTTDIDIAVAFVKKLVEIAPVFVVTGNHEGRIDNYPLLESRLKAIGATVLRDSEVMLTKSGAHIRLVGVDDPRFDSEYDLDTQGDIASMNKKLTALRVTDNGDFCVLLSHRPELIKVYGKFGVDLVFCGHAHGGQVVVPFLGALYAPHQGFLPKYTDGLYTEGKTQMIVSRGVSNSLCKLRVNDRPQVIVATLKRTE